MAPLGHRGAAAATEGIVWKCSIGSVLSATRHGRRCGEVVERAGYACANERFLQVTPADAYTEHRPILVR